MHLPYFTVFAVTLLALASIGHAFDNSRKDNLAVYWGQNSARNQERLAYYCQDDTIDAIPMAFLYVFWGEGGEPVIDFANICNPIDNQTFPGTQLADCSALATDIQECQERGKIITLSLGGATGEVGFANNSQAVQFADLIWNMFLGGQNSTSSIPYEGQTGEDGSSCGYGYESAQQQQQPPIYRPFGDAILDGVDLDIENGNSSYYATFVDRLRLLSYGSLKKYYITAAPQCPYPDASVGAALNSAPFDAVYVQFYNNYCGLDKYPSEEFNFNTWDSWAKNISLNPNVKVYVGAPASTEAAGEGYVSGEALSGIAQELQRDYDSFGGVMLWDASEAYTNGRYDRMIKDALMKGSSDETAVTASGPIVVTPTESSSNGTTTSGSSNGTSWGGANGTRTNGALEVVFQDGGEDSVFVIPLELD